MRNSWGAILFGLVLVFGAETGTAQAQDGVVTFKIRNSTPSLIVIKMYSQDRDAVWPGDAPHYVHDGSDLRSTRLACRVGELICYGASYSPTHRTYWGVGYNGDQNCASCCIRCGTFAEDAWATWNLTP